MDGHERAPNQSHRQPTRGFASVDERVEVANDQRAADLRERQFAVLARLVERALSARS